MKTTDLWIDDTEMLRRLGLDDVHGRAAIQELDRQGALPQKWPLFGDKRWWPAVLNFFLTRYGGLASPHKGEAIAATWDENFDHVNPKRNHTRAPANVARLQRVDGPSPLESKQG